ASSQAAFELGPVHPDALALVADLDAEPVDPARDARVHRDRRATDLGPDQILRDVQVPGLRQRSHALRPKLDGLFAARHEALTVLRRGQAEIEGPVDRLLLRHDGEPDALRLPPLP